jgi:hypothetical protein
LENVSDQAQIDAGFVEFLCRVCLESEEGADPRNPFMLSETLTDEEGEGLQSLIDNPPAHIPPEERPKRVVVRIEDLAMT